MKTRSLALVTFVFFLLTAFRAGWTRVETDFPNYYTAAVLVRRGLPLRKFYDWTWFQRQMNYAGTERQLGAYTPQTPLTMLPLLPLAWLPPQQAKQVWLLWNLAFLLATLWMLSRITRFRIETLWLLAFCGYFSFSVNFLYGQYYVFLLMLFTATFYFLHRRHDLAGGAAAGLAFGLKLYGAPFLLFFLAKRKWKAAAAMAATSILLGILAIAMFGWADIHYYLTQVLARSLDASSIDPYNPGSPTVSSLCFHFFLREAELNPHPLWHSPPLFFFLHALIPLGIAGYLAVGLVTNRSSDRRDFAWLLLGMMLLTTSVGSYTYLLLLLPLVLLLEESGPGKSAAFVACYVLLTIPLRPLWLFPKVWLLLGWFVMARPESWRELRRPATVAAAALIVLIALIDMRARLAEYASEPGQQFERIAVEKGAIFSCYPAITRAGLFYQSIGRDRYILRWSHDGRDDELPFDGHAFQPWAPGPDGPIDFELVAHGTSKIMEFDPASGRASLAISPARSDPDTAQSPDGDWIAFVADVNDTRQVWLRNAKTGSQRALTAGRCNSWAPAWELDSKALVFASDCGRALGLPALYRARLNSRQSSSQ